MNDVKFLDRPSTLWVTIATVIVGFAVALAFLQAGRITNAQNITDLKANYQTINEKLDKITERLNETAIDQAQIRVDVDYIKKAVIVVQDK